MQILVFYYLRVQAFQWPIFRVLPVFPRNARKTSLAAAMWRRLGKGKPEQMLNSFGASTVYCPVIGGNNKTIFTSSAKNHLSNSI